MSTKQVTRCDVCDEEISWLDGAHIDIKESSISGSKSRSWPYRNQINLDLCNLHWKPLQDAFRLLGVDAEGEHATMKREGRLVERS